MRGLAADGGILLLNEFHPIQRKLYWPEGPHNYFEAGLIEADVPNPNQDGESLGRCMYQFWTLGEIVNTAINVVFRIARLDEHPDWEDPTIPGSFTMLAEV